MKFDERVVVERPLADLAVEVDVLENVLERVGVGVFEGGEGLVEARADVGLEVADLRPVGFRRHEESVLVGVRELRRDRPRPAMPLALRSLAKLLAFLIELVAQPFQEQHAEDVFLVLRGIHVAAQVVARAEQEAGKLREGEFRHQQSQIEQESGQRTFLFVDAENYNSLETSGALARQFGGTVVPNLARIFRSVLDLAGL